MPVFTHGDFKKYTELVAKGGLSAQKIARKRAEIAKAQAKLGDLYKDLISDLTEYSSTLEKQLSQMERYSREELRDFDDNEIKKTQKLKGSAESEVVAYEQFKEQIKNLAQTSERYAKDLEKSGELLLIYCRNRTKILELDEEYIQRTEKLDAEKVRNKILSKKEELEGENSRKKGEIQRLDEAIESSRNDCVNEWKNLKDILGNMS
jgi:hypothetical protein